jgi:hypothetical protein
MPRACEELFQIPFPAQLPPILSADYDQGMWLQNPPQDGALIAAQAKPNPNLPHNPRFAYEPRKFSFKKGDWHLRFLQWKLPRDDLYRDQGDLGSQVRGQTCCGPQSFNRSFVRGDDNIHSQFRNVSTRSACSTAEGEFTTPHSNSIHSPTVRSMS